MERIAIAGLSLHGTDVGGLEAIHRPDAASREVWLRELSDVLGASEAVFLATCNRVEVVYAREEGEPPSDEDLGVLAPWLASVPERAAEVAGALVLRRGAEAVRHLFRVASSLDSLVLGEDQILAQVRDAYGVSSDIGLIGPLLGPLFHHALSVGKQVRTDTELARRPVSVVNLALVAVSDVAANYPEARPRVAIVGAGKMGSLLARVLAGTGLAPAVVTNRSADRARALANECGGKAVDLDAFRAGEHPVDVLVAATSAPGIVLDATSLARLSEVTPSGLPLFAVDLAVPRDLEPTEGVRVVDLDALRDIARTHHAARAEAAVAAERIVDNKLQTFARRLEERLVAPMVGEMQGDAHELLERELAGLMTGRLEHLTDPDRRAVERWARKTFGRLMHLPVAALKRFAAQTAPENGP